MNQPTKLRVLVVDDSPEDAMISLSELRRAGFEVVSERVDSDAALRRSLTAAEWDIAICDWSMPGFGGDMALRTRNELRPDLPWLIVSGTVSEENAVLAMQSGAQDYFNKAHLARLAPAIRRELTEAAERRARRTTSTTC